MLSVPSVISMLVSLLVLNPKSGSGSTRFLEGHCGMARHGHSSQTLGPWTALLHENGKIVCAGTLINSKFILTAAHCIKSGESLQVRLGEYGRMNAEQPENYIVDGAYRHRRYNMATMKNDIGLLRLSRPVQYKDHISPICIHLDLPSNYLSWIDSNINEFTGTAWDRTDNDRYGAGEFHAMNITRVHHSNCQIGRKTHDKYQFCGYNREAEKSCDGPSGSALSQVTRDGYIYQLGIASYNELDCQSTRAFTNVLRFSEWILKIVYHYGGVVDQSIHKSVVFPDSTKSSRPITSIPENGQTNFRAI